nr:MAG TPA: HISTONE H2A.Z, HISTONE H2B TYPE BINDING PROTEIN, HISTONE, CHAPERONE.7A [Caudoviricetes sp.]
MRSPLVRRCGDPGRVLGRAAGRPSRNNRGER